jgi:6-phosphofructokinase
MAKKRIGILTGGGDVPPLNAVIASAIENAKEKNIEVFGFRNGWQGVLEQNCVNLTDRIIDPNIGGTILKSSRVNLKKVENAKAKVEESLNKLGIDGLIVIGGDDTLSNAFSLKEIPQALVSKTIDNDVGIANGDRIVNYFTLGYPSAAEKIAAYVSLDQGLRTTAYSHERIIVVESMGMHAGWLACASSFGHPDFIIIPEFPLAYESLLEKVIEKYNKQKHLIIVAAEGSKWKDGNYISANENEKDNFGHPKFKGIAETLAEKIKNDLKKISGIYNVNSVNPSYLYRSGNPDQADLYAAGILGKKAIELLSQKINEPVFLTLAVKNSNFEVEEYYLKDLKDIEEFHRFVGDNFYDPSVFYVTDKFKKYLLKVISEHSQPNYIL